MLPGATNPVSAATSSSVVGARVLSATSISVAACAPSVAGSTAFVMPVATAQVSSTTCDVAAGSSNDSVHLRVFQADGEGQAMHKMTTGELAPSGFGTGGRVFHAALGGSARVNDALEQPDGKLVLVGSASNGTNTDVVVMRLMPDGSLDATFDGTTAGNGVVTFDVAGNDSAQAVVLDSLGRIAIAGIANPGSPDSMVLRLLPDGSLDTTFAGDGSAVVNFGSQDEAFSIAVRPDNRLVVGGHLGGYVLNYVTVFDTTGLQWSGFAGGGRWQARSPGGSFEQTRIVRVMPDGRVMGIARRESPGPRGMLAYMLLPDGSGVDTSWGTGGWTLVSSPTGNLEVWDAVQDRAGGTVMIGSDPADFAAARLTPAGLLDTSWGASGIATANVSGADEGYAGVLEPTGDIAILGRTGSGNFARARVGPTGVVAPGSPLPQGHQLDMTGNDTARDVLVRSDGGLLVFGEDGTRFAAAKLVGVPFGNYDQSTNGFTTGSSTSGFGVCLDSVTNGAPTWPAVSGCPPTDTGHWRALPATSGSPGAEIARRAGAGGPDMVGRLRFGLRTSGNQLSGRYVAPVVFEVVAPA